MSIKTLLNQSITLYSRQGYSSSGDEQFSSGSTVRARIVENNTRHLAPDGSLITIDAVAYLGPGVSVSTDDKVNYNSTDYKVSGIYVARGKKGEIHHQKLELIKWHPE